MVHYFQREFIKEINFDAVPLIDILLILNTVVSLTVQLLLILWLSIEDSDEYYTRKIGHLWIILGFLFLTNILLFATISEGYTLTLKNSPNFDNYLVVVGNLIVQITIFVSSLFIGILMTVPENRPHKVKKVKFSRKLFRQWES